MTDPIFDDAAAMRAEIEHLRKLATMTSDSGLLGQIEALIGELERQLMRLEGGSWSPG